MPGYFIEISRNRAIAEYYSAQALGLFGLVVWELVVSVRFEWRFVQERTWPPLSILLYLGNRVALFLHLLSTVINLFETEAIPCNAQIWISNITTSIVIWCSGLILASRLLKVWTSIDRMMGFLGMILAILMVVNCLTWQTPTYVWDSTLFRCIPRQGERKPFILAQYTYTLLCYIVLTALFTYQLLPRKGWLEVKYLMGRDGLGVFVLVTTVWLAQTVLVCIWLNDLMIRAFLPLVLTITVIAITRSYMFEKRRAYKYIFRKKPVDRIAKKGPVLGGGTAVSTVSAKGKEPVRGRPLERNSMFTSGLNQV